MEKLREQLDDPREQLSEAERAWQHLQITRQTVHEILTEPEPEPEPGAGAERSPAVAAAPPRSIVPLWRPGADPTGLVLDDQRIMAVLADHHRIGGEGLTCRQIAEAMGIELTPAKIEGVVRSRTERLAARGRLARTATDAFILAGQPADHQQGHRPADHRRDGCGEPFVVAGQAAGAHQPGEGALDHPPPRQRHEGAVLPGRPGDHDEAHVQDLRGVVDQVGGKGAVGEDCFKAGGARWRGRTGCGRCGGRPRSRR